jgi:hypothetical protein
VTSDLERLGDAVLAASRIAARLRRSQARFAAVVPLRGEDVAAFDDADRKRATRCSSGSRT